MTLENVWRNEFEACMGVEDGGNVILYGISGMVLLNETMVPQNAKWFTYDIKYLIFEWNFKFR
jgi:hypothetical protein